jgi:hypothetical protein
MRKGTFAGSRRAGSAALAAGPGTNLASAAPDSEADKA